MNIKDKAVMRRCPHCGHYTVPKEGTLLKGGDYLVYQCGYCGNAWPEAVDTNTQSKVDICWQEIISTASRVILGAQCAGNYAYKGITGQTTIDDLETFKTILCDIKRNADDLLCVFRRLKAEEWEEKHKEDDEDEIDLRCDNRD
jgi:hypothetical protein